ncbi:RNA dependent RNA polymerase-domain-containing protein [Pilobolus umbonatus]|nr:RNA dependent RNA polymerase-domain-containing protein [Pilobolus umbonatus]
MISAEVNSDAVCFVVTNLDKKTLTDDIWSTFMRYGKLKQVELMAVEEKMVAAIIYAIRPLHDICHEYIQVQGSRVVIREIPVSEYLNSQSRPLSASTFSIGGMATPLAFIEEWGTSDSVKFDINHKESTIMICFRHFGEYYRMIFDYDSTITKKLNIQRMEGSTSIIMTPSSPGYFYKMGRDNQWERITDICADRAKLDPCFRSLPVSPHDSLSPKSVQLNNWIVYRVVFDISDKSHEGLLRRIKISTGYSPQHTTPQRSTLLRVFPATLHQTCYQDLIIELPFPVQYMIEHMFSLRILSVYNIKEDFFQRIKSLGPVISHNLLMWMSAIHKRIYTPLNAIRDISKMAGDYLGDQEYIPEGGVHVWKLIITPTSIYPLQPTIQPMMEVQYQFKKYADRFLLVQFTDEDIGPLQYSPHNGRLYDRIYKILTNGIQLAGRLYTFAGTSTALMKSHSCWFFAPTNKFNASMMYQWLGELSEIDSVPRYIACMGQAFDRHIWNLKLKSNEIAEMDDVENFGHNFTQGTGKMSPEVARLIKAGIGLDYSPSVIEFNLAGATGVLVVSNFLRKRSVQLRTNQIDYYSANFDLRVTGYSQYKPAYLNRQSILLLANLGINNRIFDQRLEELIGHYEKSNLFKHGRYKTFIVDYLSGSLFKSFQALLDTQLLDRGDPFLQNIMKAYQNKLLRDMKEDGLLPIEQGARAYAVMDETGTLGQNEVFFQAMNTSDPLSTPHILNGACIIFRDHSCYPGDVRKLFAVDHPKLRHLKNVIVFSQHDYRDLPSACSNDNIKGANFTIIWDHDLVPARANLAYRTYTTAKPTATPNEITLTDVAKFFVNFISMDKTDAIENAYTTSIDSSGVNHGESLFLAEQKSRALDFATTGVCAQLPDEFYHTPSPDFVECNALKSYKSKSINGYNYRTAKVFKYHEITSNYPVYYDTRIYAPHMNEYIAQARTMKTKYDYQLKILLIQYSIQSEIEFISGCIIHWPKWTTPKERKQLAESIHWAYHQLKQSWRSKIESTFKDDPGRESKMEAMAAALYYITYHPTERNNHRHLGTEFFSFPWVMDDILCSLASKDHPLHTSMYTIPEDEITQHFSQRLIVDVSDSEDESEDESDLGEDEYSVYQM